MTADWADLQLVRPGSISFFVVRATFQFYNFLCKFSADSLWAAQHRKSDGTGRDEACPTGLRSRQQKGRGERYWKIKNRERKSVEVCSVFSDVQLTFGPSSFFPYSFIWSFFAVACPVRWPHRSYFLFQNKSSPQYSIWLFLSPPPL